MTSIDPADVARVDGLLSRLPAPPPLSAAQVARIRNRIDDEHHHRRAAQRFATALAFTLVLGTAVAIAMYTLRLREIPVVPAPIIVPEPELDSRPAMPRRLTANESPAPEPAPEAALPTTATPAPQPPSRVATKLAEEGTLGVESRLIATALRQLRQQRSPSDALTTLDRYAARFPRGVLVQEARAARIEALLASGDKRAALALLDAGPVKSDLAVARGELRLEAGRVEEAAHDFESAMIGANDEIEQRALYGRAACRVRLGDEQGTRRDLEHYLRRFPNGRFAAAAKKVLDRISMKGSSATGP